MRSPRRIFHAITKKIGVESSKEDCIHFLHVSKAAGSQLKRLFEILNAASPDRRIVAHSHEVSLYQLPSGQPYFFPVRDPIGRFRSGFYSRLRKGKPLNDSEWSPEEAVAFADFPHANDLAEALFRDDAAGRKAAAMRSIRHTSRNLVDWFKFCGELFEVRPPVWIIRQERFRDDIAVFLEKIGKADVVDDGFMAERAHANDYSATPALSDLAKENLRRWYAQDYEFLRLCDDWLAGQAA